MSGGPIDCIADTSVIVGLLRKNPQIEKNIAGRNFAITYVTLAELSLGVFQIIKTGCSLAADSGNHSGRIMFQISPNTPVIYARIYFELEQRGMVIPINDIWIAALAMETGLPILARDEHFSRTKGLTVIAC